MSNPKHTSNQRWFMVCLVCGLTLVWAGSLSQAYAADAEKAFEPPLPTAVSLAINDGDASTTTRSVTLNNVAVDYPQQYMASEDPNFVGGVWQTYDAAPPFMLSAGNGSKTVYFKVRNITGESNVVSDSILLVEPPVLTAFTINNDAAMTNVRPVVLNNTCTNSPTEYMASEDSNFDDAVWQPYNTAPAFTLSEGNGTKTVYFMVRNQGGVSNVLADSINLIEPPQIEYFEINDGDPTTISRDVLLVNQCTNDPTEYMASENPSFTGATWQPYETFPTFTLSAGDGSKSVYLKVRNAGGESGVDDDDIELAEVVPPVVLTFAINNGAVSTTTTLVTLDNTCANDPTEYMASESPTFDGATWQPYGTAPDFDLSDGNGTKTVYFKVRNEAGESSVATDDILLDVPPPPPTLLSFAINNGATMTTTPNVTLNNTCDGNPVEYLASEDPSFTGAVWMPYSPAPAFTLSDGNGVKTVYFKVRNASGDSSVLVDTIILDVPPPPPVVVAFAINGGAATTSTWTVLLDNACTGDPTEYMASENSDFAGASWLPYDIAPQFVLSFGNGEKEVFFKVRNAGGESNIASDTIGLDAPVLPIIVSFVINDGAPKTTTRDVMLSIECTGNPTQCMVSESPAFVGAVWESYQDSMPFTLSENTGTKTVYVKVRNAAGESATATDSILYALPAPPDLVSMQINNGAPQTTSRNVMVQTVCTNNPTLCKLSEDPSMPGDWIPYSPELPFVLSPGSGEKIVYFIGANDDGDTGVHWDSIVLFITQPPTVLRFSINNGATKTISRNVTLNSSYDDIPTEYLASESPTFDDAVWLPYDEAAPFTLSPGLGMKTVYFMVRNDKGESDIVSDSIELVDEAPPEILWMAIDDGAQSTTTNQVTLNNLCAIDPTEYMASEDLSFADTSWAPYDPAPQFTLSPGGGRKVVYLKVRNIYGESDIVQDAILVNLLGIPILEEFAINGGADATPLRNVTLNHLCANGPTLYMASERPDFYGAIWMPYDPEPSFRLSPIFGMKTVYFKTRNSEGISETLQDDIEYVSLVPTVVSFVINGGDPQTQSREVMLESVCSGAPVECIASESPDFDDAQWGDYAPAMHFTLSPDPGLKQVFLMVRNSAGESAVFTDDIELVGCSAPDAPTGVEATNWEQAWIYVVWNPVEGDNVEYRVYRNGSPCSGWQSHTVYADYQNIACTSNAEHAYTVVARNDCGTSPQSAVDDGLGRTNLLPVAPSGLMVPRDGGIDFAVRWRHHCYAVADTLTMTASLDGDVPGTWSWLPDQGANADGWMVFHPTVALPDEGMLYVVGTAKALQQQTMISFSYSFDLSTMGDAIVDPAIQESPAGLVAPIDPLSGGTVYEIQPRALYTEPLTIQLPVPDGMDPDTAELWYHGETATVSGSNPVGTTISWCSSNLMHDWIVPGSRQIIEIDGQTYFEVQLNYGGTVQLSAPKNKIAAAGTCAFAILVLGVFILGGKNSPMRRKHLDKP